MIRESSPNAREAGPELSGDLPLAGEAYFRAVSESDMGQVVGLWLTGLASLFLGLMGANTMPLRYILAAAVLWLVGIEIRNFIVDECLLLRARTAVLLSFSGYILLSPLINYKWMEKVPPEACYTATSASLLFLALALTVYALVNPRSGASRGVLEKFTVDLDLRFAFFLLLFCFTAEIGRRVYLQDWSSANSIVLGLLGTSAAPWAPGRFGDWRVVFYPVDWMYSLIPGLAAIALVKARSTFHRVIIYMIAGSTLFSLLFQRSRFVFIIAVGTLIGIVLLQQRDRRARMRLYAICIVLVPVLVICANLILSNRLTGSLAQTLEGAHSTSGLELNAKISTVLEDNLEFFAKAASVVPSKVPFRSPFELYYFMAIHPIPRYFWPNKPYMSQKYLGGIRPEYASMSGIGDLYVYGGWLHVLLGALVYGYFLKRLDMFGKAKPHPETGRILIYVLFMLLLFVFPRALWSTLIQSYAVLLMLLMLYIIKRVQEQSRLPIPSGNAIPMGFERFKASNRNLQKTPLQ